MFKSSQTENAHCGGDASHQQKESRLDSHLLTSILCRERRTGPKLTLCYESKLNLFGSDGTHYVMYSVKQGKD